MAKAQLLLGAYVFLQAAFLLGTELRQIRAIGLALYLRSPWNVLDLLSLSLMLVIMPFYVARYTSLAGGALSPMIAFEVSQRGQCMLRVRFHTLSEEGRVCGFGHEVRYIPFQLVCSLASPPTTMCSSLCFILPAHLEVKSRRPALIPVPSPLASCSQLIMVYFKLFFYGLGFETSGPLVQMVFTIGWLIKDWAVLLFLNMVAFGTALMVSRRLASFLVN